MRSRYKWILGITGGLAFGIGLGLAFFDWNWLRGPLTSLAHQKTGREIAIGGIAGEWALKPRFSFDAVHVGNLAWAGKGDMLVAERIEVVIDLPALLRGKLILPELTVQKPKLGLLREAADKANWLLDDSTDSTETGGDSVQIGRLRIRDGEVRFRDTVLGLNVQGKIASGLSGSSIDDLRFQGRGDWQKQPFAIQLTGGSLLSLREATAPYPLAVDFSAGDSKARIRGHVGDPLRFEGLDLELQMQGPNLALLSELTGIPLPLTPAYDLKAQVGRKGAIWTLRNLSGTMGRSDIAGNLQIDIGRPRLFIEADLRSKRLDYRDMGALIGVGPQAPVAPPAIAQNPAPAAGQQSQLTQRTAPIRVLPDAPLMVEEIRQVDAKVKFQADQVVAPNAPLDGVKLTLDLQDGVLSLAPLALDIAGGRTVARITIDARKDRVRSDYDIALIGFQLERFLDAAGMAGRGEGKLHGRIKLVGWGDSLRKSLASADGEIKLTMHRGKLSNLAMELAGLDVAQALGFAIAGDKTTPINCMVGDIAVAKGVATPKLFLLDTDDSTLTMEGNIDLASESLGLRMLAHPKDTSLLSLRAPITIGGHFSKPSIGVEGAPLAARAAGAVLLGVIFTPLASLLAFIEPGLQGDSDCATLLQQQKR